MANKRMAAEGLEKYEKAAEILEGVDGMKDMRIHMNALIVRERVQALLAALEPLDDLRVGLNRLVAALDE